MSKEKVFVILSPGFAASESDTTCLPMQQLFAKTLSKMYPQFEIIVISFQYPFQRKTYSWNEIQIISLGGKNKGSLSRWLLRRKAYAALQMIHAEKEIAGLLSFWLGECAFVGKQFALKNNLKHYCWLLGQDARKGNKFVNRIHPEPEELIALSDSLQAEFERNYSIKPSTVIPPGMSALKASPFKRDIELLGVGSLIPLKRYELFIEIVAEIKKQIPFIKAALIGKGPEKERLQQLIEEYSLSENIFLADEIPYAEVLNYMARSKILLHPSGYEGFSGACLEALSAGVKVISFVKPMNEDIKNWNVVNTKDEMIEKAINILKDNTTVYVPVVFRSMEETVQRMMALFN